MVVFFYEFPPVSLSLSFCTRDSSRMSVDLVLRLCDFFFFRPSSQRKSTNMTISVWWLFNGLFSCSLVGSAVAQENVEGQCVCLKDVVAGRLILIRQPLARIYQRLFLFLSVTQSPLSRHCESTLKFTYTPRSQPALFCSELTVLLFSGA